MGGFSAYCYLEGAIPLRVEVPNNHILTQNLYYNYYYPNPKYIIIGYMDPLGPAHIDVWPLVNTR